MFTGLIAATGKILALRPSNGGVRLTLEISGLPEIPAVGASLAVNGSCLTATAVTGGTAEFDAVAETVVRTKLARQRAGELVNLEPALRFDGRIDGHFVQGHVDGTGRVLTIEPRGESQIWRFSMPPEIAPLVALKGSVAVDGVSLTVCEISRDQFAVSLIPHTVAHTTFARLRAGDEVNLEADVLARYLARKLEFPQTPGVTEDLLRRHGFA